MDEWLTTTQAGELVGRSGDWVRQQVLQGRLRAETFLGTERRTYRIRRDDFEEFRARYMSVGEDTPR